MGTGRKDGPLWRQDAALSDGDPGYGAPDATDIDLLAAFVAAHPGESAYHANAILAEDGSTAYFGRADQEVVIRARLTADGRLVPESVMDVRVIPAGKG
jgi:non-ribosomal peptide synthetase component F